MRNWSRDSGKYHANSPAGAAAISGTLLLRASVTMVMSAEQGRDSQCIFVRLAR